MARSIVNSIKTKVVRKIITLLLPALALSLFAAVSCDSGNEIPPGMGIAWLYPGDEGIGDHPSVVFAENFESGTLEDIAAKWGHMSNRDGKVMSFSSDTPEGSRGKRSLRVTATRNENAGGELYKTFDPGWDKIYLRFYTKFAADHGSHHHFVALRGFRDPLPYPTGGAGRRAENHFSVTIEPTMFEINAPATIHHDPPGIWQFYAYWPEMRSWQSLAGEPDGRPNPYYGNSFQPEAPAIVPRDKWIAVEIMVKLNSSADAYDGQIALWIDGEPVVRFAPGVPHGYWVGDRFRNDPGYGNAVPFEGFRWRHDMDVKINVLRLQHYVSETSFSRTGDFFERNPGFPVNMEKATVWFDNIVMATEYIGPVRQEEQKESSLFINPFFCRLQR